MHLMRKTKEIREFERKVVLQQIENVQRTLDNDVSMEARTYMIENAISIV
jgi:hypothetical protein